MERSFPLADVLSVLHARSFTRNAKGLSEFVGFLMGSGGLAASTSQLLIHDILLLQPGLRKQLSELTAATEPPAKFANEAATFAWVAEMERLHGVSVNVKPTFR